MIAAPSPSQGPSHPHLALLPRRLPGVVLAVAVAVALASGPALGFADLPGTTPEGRAAQLLADRGIMPPVAPDQFGPTRIMTRYEVALALNGLLDPRDQPFNLVAFSDIPSGHWAERAVQRVVGFRIMDARGGRFEGLLHVSRLDFLRLIEKTLAYRSVLPPAPRGGRVTFRDVAPGSPAYDVVNGAANSWGLLDNPRRRPLRPYEGITRVQAAQVLARALGLLDPTVAAALRAIPSPVPATASIEPTEQPSEAPSVEPLATPHPRHTALPTPEASPLPTPEPTPEPTPSPPTPPPTPAPSLAPTAQPSPAPSPSPSASTPTPGPAPTVTPSPVPTPERLVPHHKLRPYLESSFTLGYAPLMVYVETLPSDPGRAAPGEQGNLQGAFFGGFGGQGAWWTDAWGVQAGGFATSVAASSSAAPGSLLIYDAHVAGLVRLPWRSPQWEAAAGGALLVQGTSGPDATRYLTGSKFSGGLGPAGAIAGAPYPNLLLEADGQVYPLIVQAYTVANTPISVPRFGVGFQGTALYALGRYGPWNLGLTAQFWGSTTALYDVSGVASAHGIALGVGGWGY